MEKTTNIYRALNIIQCKLVATKDQYNNFGKYPYRNAESILANVKPYLAEYGLILTLTDEVVLLGDRFYVRATATLTNGTEQVQATAYAREEENKKGMDGSQVTGASSSYARKYALCGLFAIDGEKDADYLNNSPEYTQREDTKAQPKVSKQTIKALEEAKKALEACKSRQEVVDLWNGVSKEVRQDKEFTSLVSAKGSSFNA